MQRDIASTSFISVGNSSNTDLDPSNSYTFTGEWESTLHPDIMVNLYTDKPCSVSIQFSNDGTTIHSTLPRKTSLGTDGKYRLFTTIIKGARSARVVVTTESLTTTEFSLQTQYGLFRQGNKPLNSSLSLSDDAQVVRSTFVWLDVARGLFQGIESIKKFGRNSSVGTSFVPVSIGGIYRTPQAGSATPLRIKAGNTNDTAAGTGAREVTIIGLDENFEVASEALATAGTSASGNTSTNFLRNYRSFVSESGTYATASAGSHTDDIVIEKSTGGEDWSTIDATSFPKSQSEIGAFTIPAGKIGFVKLRDLSIDSGKTVDMIFFSRANADEVAPPYSAMRAQSVVTGVSGGSIETFGAVDVPFGPYTGPTDIGFMAKVANGTASVSVEFEIFLIDA